MKFTIGDLIVISFIINIIPRNGLPTNTEHRG